MVIWNSGYEIMTNKTPFFDRFETQLWSNDVPKAKITYPDTMSPDAIDLVSKLLKTNPKERLHLQDIRNHEFLKISTR